MPTWLTERYTLFGNLKLSILDGFVLIALLVLVWWAGALLEKAINRAAIRRRGARGVEPVAYAGARVGRYLVWVIGILLVLGYLGINLTSFAIVAGAIGVVLGLHLQGIISNFFSGLTMLMEGTLKVGDFVDLESGVRGHVREIGFRYTRITTSDLVDVIVPNSEFVTHRVINRTLDNPRRRIRIPFSVAYGADKDKVKAVVLSAARACEVLYEDELHVPDVWLVALGDSALEFQLAAWVAQENLTRPARTEARFMWAIHSALVDAGIEIPFPQRDGHFRNALPIQTTALDCVPPARDSSPTANS